MLISSRPRLSAVALRTALPALLVLVAGCAPLLESSVRGLREGLRSPASQLMAAAPDSDTEVLYVEVPGEARAAVHVAIEAPGQPGVRWWAAPDGVTVVTRAGRVQATDGLPGDLLDLRWLQAPVDWQPSALASARLIKVRDAYQGAVAGAEHAYGFSSRRDRVMIWGGEKRELLRLEERPEPVAPGIIAWPGDRIWLDPATGLVYRLEVHYRPDRVMVLLPRRPWPWIDAGLAGLQRRLPVQQQADPLTLRLRMDGRIRLHEALARVPAAPDALGLRLLQRSALAGQRVEQQVLHASLQAMAATAITRWPGLPAWRQVVASTPINGLTPLPASTAVRSELLPSKNPWLDAGDRLVLGHRALHLRVWDPRAEQACERPYTPWRTVTDYLTECLAGRALPDHVWLAGPDGSVRRLAVASWNAEPAVWPAPGSAVVIDDPALARAAAQPDLAAAFARLVVRDFEGGAAP